MTEAEEFEFQLQMEKEQAAASKVAPTTFKGAMSEINKGIGRGATSMPLAAAGAIRTPIDLLGKVASLVPGAPESFGQPGVLDRTRQLLGSSLKATPANPTEQMLGTGAEMVTGGLYGGTGGGRLPEQALGILAPAAGAVAGEQVGGEQGKLIGSVAAPVGLALAGRALSPRLSPELDLLTKEGTQLTPGQQTGGFLKKFEDFPIIKEFTGSAKNRAIESYNNTVLNVALKPLGKKVDAIGFEGFKKADQIAQQAYDDVLPKLTVKYDPQFSAEMASQRAAAPRAVRADLEDIFNREVAGKLTQGTANIPPRTMKEIDSELGRLARRYMKDSAVNSQNIADGIRDIQGAFRDMVARQNPQHVGELQKVNAAWNNLIRVQDAVNRAGNTSGVFTPNQFQTSVKMMDASLKRKAFSSGNAAMQGISDAGVKVLGGGQTANVPYAALRSGVAGIGGAAAGAGVMATGATGFGAPILGAAGTLGALYSPVGQRAAQMALTGPRPAPLLTLGNMMRNTPFLPTAASPAMFTQGEE